MEKGVKTLGMAWSQVVACVFVLLVGASAHAADEAGSLLGIKGDVRAAGAIGDRVLLKSDPIYVGETITTGDNSYAVIKFVDGAKATIRPNSELKVENYQFNRAQDGALLNLVKGGLRAVTGQIAQNKHTGHNL